jgi:hypothetical protein
MMKRSRILTFAAAVLVLLEFPPDVPAQSQLQSSNPRQPVAPPEGVPAPAELANLRKVWTEDDLKSLRKPWDIEQDREEAVKEQASMAAAHSDAATPIASREATVPTLTLSDSSPLPRTIGGAQGKISTVQNEIGEMKSNLEKLREGYLNARDEAQRSKLKRDVELAEDDLQERQGDLKLIQDWLEFLKDEEAQKWAQTDPASLTRPEDQR